MKSRENFLKALKPAVGDHLTDQEIIDLIEVPNHPDHGDLAFPAFSLAPILKKAPQQIAQDIVEKMDKSQLSSAEAVGPYVNIHLKRQVIGADLIHEILEKDRNYGNLNIGAGENMVIDCSSPNIAKPMSMGHLRSTVIGNALGNLAEKVGYQAIKINHLGDWGTQFGRLIVAYKMWGDEEVVKANPVKELVALYVRFHEEMEDQPELEEKGRIAFKKLEEGDQEYLELWEWFKDESLKEFQAIYDLLGVEFDSYKGEAFYNDKMEPVVSELEEKGLTVDSEGATIVELDDESLPPALIKKSDGATLYLTRDLAAVLYRKKEYNFSKALYVVGNEQTVHFRQLKGVIEKMGYDWADDIVHVPFGLITLKGEKLSTRKGKSVLLEDVLQEAIDLAYKQINESNPDLENKDQVAQDVGVGAVIFYDLKTDRMTGYDFNLDDIVRFEGETGPYVQYTYARSRSILRKADYQRNLSVDFKLTDDYSWAIVKKLADYPRVLERAIEKYEVSYIAKYAIELAQLFNKYYANVRILTEDSQRDSRLALLEAMDIVLEDALAILGLKAPEEM